MDSTSDLRRPIEHLAAIDRASCSAGESQAAAWIAAALRELGADAVVEEESVHGTYWWPLGLTSALGLTAAVVGRRGRRLSALALGALAGALVVDDLGAGARWLRRLLPKQRTANVLAWAGDRTADRTVMLVSHHDAAHSGFFFNPRIEAAFGRIIRRGGSGPPRYPGLMVPIAAGPAVSGVGGLVRSRGLMALGGLVCAGIIVSFLDIALRPTVPGANDNLTGVATVLAVAKALEERPVRGIRVLLVSTGAEEALMEGMRALAARHFPELDPARTSVICVDCVGSPRLVLSEAEGMLKVRRYDESLKERIAGSAAAAGIDLVRGITIRLGTDGYLALRHGFPAATLMSVNEWGTPSNYHWPTDTPDRVDYRTLADAARLCELVVRQLASDAAAQ